ncbi:MAG: hypothetical protein JXR68_14170 [Bacteroidales bacterium]|nr:hypothetical protein [Bacteroidales bacterium]
MNDLSVNEKVLLGIDSNNEVPELNFDIDSEDELSAVARQIKRFNEAVTTKGKKVRVSKNVVKKEIGASKRRMQVLERVSSLPANHSKNLVEGKEQISDKVLFSTTLMSSIVGNQLISTDGGEAVGVRNFSNGKYKHPFLLQAIQILFDDTSVEGTFDDDLPVQILNGNITIQNNAKTLIEKLPVSALATVNGYPLDKPFNTYELDNPKWFEANTDVQAILNLSSALTDGAIRINFIGTEVRPI